MHNVANGTATIQNNIMEGLGGIGSGIYCEGSDSIQIVSITILYFDSGIKLEDSLNVLIIENSCQYNSVGIRLTRAHSASLNSNNCSFNTWGIASYYTNYTRIQNNYLMGLNSMTFFTTADLLEIGKIPFPSTAQKPTRQMALDYYRKIVQNFDLNVEQHHLVKDIKKHDELFLISGEKVRKGEKSLFEISSKYVLVATGYFDNPCGLGGIPGEQGENASYYYSEPHQFSDKEVVVIGAGNSGAEAALELYRHGAAVTLVHRHPKPRSTIKYWVAPDLKNRLKEGSIKGIMPAEVKEIVKDGAKVVYKGEEVFIPADFIFILTGFTPDIFSLKKWGIAINPEDLSANLSDVFESNIKGLFVVGSAGFGRATNKVFIENGREHAKIAVEEIAKRI